MSNTLTNFMDAMCSPENFMLAYRSAIKGKRRRLEVLLFNRNLEANLEKLRQEVIDGTYRVGPYHQFYVTVPKTRLVMALEFRDRIVQWALYRQLNPYIDKRFIPDSFGCRDGKGTLNAALRLLGWMQEIRRKPDYANWYCLKLDISKFFYRVDHKVMLEMLRDICPEQDFLALMDTIINNPDVPFGLPEGIKAHDCPPEDRLFDVGMPIGNLSSQMMANLYLDYLDKFCKHVLGIHYYVRYMDDIIILDNDLQRLQEWKRRIEAYVNERLKLKLNNKTSIRKAKSGIEFVGYVVRFSGMQLRKKSKKHIKNALKHCAEAYAAGHISYDKAMATVDSYFGMLQHCDSYHLRRWISDNIVFKRDAEAQAIPNDENIPSAEWLEYFIASEDE